MVGPLNRRRGLTLVEVMLALGILAVAILGLVALFGSGLRLQSQSDRVSAATEIGQAFLERVRDGGVSGLPDHAAVFDGRVPSTPDAASGFPPAPYPQVDRQGTIYHLVVEVVTHGADRRSVQVQVHWGENSRIALESSYVP